MYVHVHVCMCVCMNHRLGKKAVKNQPYPKGGTLSVTFRKQDMQEKERERESLLTTCRFQPSQAMHSFLSHVVSKENKECYKRDLCNVPSSQSRRSKEDSRVPVGE